MRIPSLILRIYLDAEEHIGHGKIELLENIRSRGSISAAGRATNMVVPARVGSCGPDESGLRVCRGRYAGGRQARRRRRSHPLWFVACGALPKALFEQFSTIVRLVGEFVSLAGAAKGGNVLDG
jgi:hypothetical protein